MTPRPAARTTWRVVPIGLVALVAAGCGGRSTAAPTTSSNPRVVAVGDSITEGNRSGEVPYPARLEVSLRARNPEAQVINRGVGGQRTSAGIGSVGQALAADSPGFVLILEGSNDVDGFRPTNQTLDNLRQMIGLARVNGVVPVIGTIPPQFGPHAQFMDAVIELNDGIRRLAREEGTRLAEVFGALPDPSYLESDGLHPSDRGDAAIAAAFDAALAQAGYPMARRVVRR